MTLFDEITEKLSKKCLYVVSLPDYPKGEISRPDTITKGGYTEDDLEYRISKFNFSGKMKGKEKDIQIDYRHFRFNADSLEKLLHLVLRIKGIEKVNDKNLGSGYTEWYFCSPKQMNAHVLTTIRAYRQILKKKKAKKILKKIKNG
tara:strand:+ start:756 stop:1193 length:438 start_codon:yes stop_codon:yes gene_type:complete